MEPTPALVAGFICGLRVAVAVARGPHTATPSRPVSARRLLGRDVVLQEYAAAVDQFNPMFAQARSDMIKSMFFMLCCIFGGCCMIARMNAIAKRLKGPLEAVISGINGQLEQSGRALRYHVDSSRGNRGMFIYVRIISRRWCCAIAPLGCRADAPCSLAAVNHPTGSSHQ